ncbi:proton channel OtopLc [Caerostris extrusa]|uniref:Proton channel OtopLc n=1 Tax=Caerostris extrusa TaxID=172846 RepID=A0AAV4RAY7_CAEEX|nr:proton channel OtopLc [Caerostris extrusa]
MPIRAENQISRSPAFLFCSSTSINSRCWPDSDFDARGGHQHLRVDPHGGQGDPAGDREAPPVAGEATPPASRSSSCPSGVVSEEYVHVFTCRFNLLIREELVELHQEQQQPLPEAGHHGINRVGLLPFPLPLHRGVQPDRGRRALRHVEEHRQGPRLRGALRGRPLQSIQRTDPAQDELRGIFQRPLLRPPGARDPLLAIFLSDVSPLRHHGAHHLHHRHRLLPHPETQVPGGQDRPPQRHPAHGRGLRPLRVRAMFGIIAGTLSPKDYVPNLLVMVTSCLTIVQVTLQSLFVAEITCRTTYLPEHDQTKPGRQVVAFLMMGNLTLWIIYTFEMQKAEASPVQLGFYGFMAWTVIVRATLPLSIFYRFHSSITFAEVWKNSYKNVSA